MPKVDEGAETLSRCPRCLDAADKNAEPHCPLCEGSGLVSGKTAVVWNRMAETADASSAE